MINYAIVKNNKVVNIIVWDGLTPYQPPQGCSLVLVEGACAIGDYHANGRFTTPTGVITSTVESIIAVAKI